MLAIMRSSHRMLSPDAHSTARSLFPCSPLREHRQQQAAATSASCRPVAALTRPSPGRECSGSVRLFAGPACRALRLPVHIFYPEILNTYKRAVLADPRPGLVQEVLVGVGRRCVTLLNFGQVLNLTLRAMPTSIPRQQAPAGQLTLAAGRWARPSTTAFASCCATRHQLVLEGLQAMHARW